MAMTPEEFEAYQAKEEAEEEPGTRKRRRAAVKAEEAMRQRAEDEEEDDSDDEASGGKAKYAAKLKKKAIHKEKIQGLVHQLNSPEERLKGTTAQKKAKVQARVVQDHRERVRRERIRREHRAPDPPELGQLDTGFGTVTLAPGLGDGAFVRSSADQFPGSTAASNVGGSYEELLGAAEPQTIQLAIAHSKRRTSSPRDQDKYFAHYFPGGAPAKADLHPDQQRILSMLLGVEQSEDQRHRGGPKGFRAGLRRALTAATPQERHIQAFQAFPQGSPGEVGKDAEAAFATGARALHDDGKAGSLPLAKHHLSQSITGGAYSESSDDDDPEEEEEDGKDAMA